MKVGIQDSVNNGASRLSLIPGGSSKTISIEFRLDSLVLELYFIHLFIYGKPYYPVIWLEVNIAYQKNGVLSQQKCEGSFCEEQTKLRFISDGPKFIEDMRDIYVSGPVSLFWN